MEQYTATMLNWSLALGAFALGGVLWAAVVFLGVAVVRLSIEVQSLRRENAELSMGGHPARDQFVDTGFREARPGASIGRGPMASQA